MTQEGKEQPIFICSTNTYMWSWRTRIPQALYTGKPGSVSSWRYEIASSLPSLCNLFYYTSWVHIHLWKRFVLLHAWTTWQCHLQVLYQGLSSSLSPQSKYLVCQHGHVSRCSCLSLCFNRLTPGFPHQCQSNTPALIRTALRCVTDCSVSP